MLQTFGFDISIDHPHTHVIRATQFMRGEISQVYYLFLTNFDNDFKTLVKHHASWVK